MADPLLSVRDLHVRFDGDDGTVRAVDGVDFDVRTGETVCLVGESGSGKTVACESITRLISTESAEITGEVRFDGTDLTALSESALESYRGGRIGHVFQNPQDALDPVYTVGAQVVEAIRIHRDVSKSAARAEAIELLDRVGIGDVTERFDDYPHQFSGGMKQRAVVAMALACDPDILIADEPTTALDVTIQRQVLELLADLQEEREMALLFVTHDLGVVAEVADRVVVMYAGNVMETADVYELFDAPAHPYTRALLDCLPGRGEGFETIGGAIPDPTDPPAGCRFRPRCPHAIPECEGGDQPGFRPVGPADGEADGDGANETGPVEHRVSCVLYDDTHGVPSDLEGGR
ncbi:ABC transporter ATP-binding protein [Halosimplex salinum]|uniref:ABC transporter ATP-binding protein n=1 Tax=Halosimplex salinum TaxID=1710538 RepID=UPI000F472CF2|nr:ABC transporter ATP-binding protein [Halosimplex salinum]